VAECRDRAIGTADRGRLARTEQGDAVALLIPSDPACSQMSTAPTGSVAFLGADGATVFRAWNRTKELCLYLAYLVHQQPASWRSLPASLAFPLRTLRFWAQ